MNDKPIELDMDFMETIIAFNSIFNESFLSSIIDIADPKLFRDKNIQVIFKIITEFYKTNSAIPTITEIKAHLVSEEDKKAAKIVFQSFKHINTKFNIDELLKNSEQFFRERSLYDAIETTLKDHSNRENKTDASKTLELFTKACNISLVDNLGHDYFKDIENHITSLNVEHQYIKTGYDWLDKILGGGLLKDGRSLYVFSGVTNSGKSIVLGNLGVNIVSQNKTVVIISLEMSEDMYTRRTSSQLSRIPFGNLKSESTELQTFVKSYIETNPNSNLYIKEFSPKSITVSHIRAYVEKLMRKKKIKPDVLIVDYVNLLLPSVVTGSSYTDIKSVTEQLRALSYVFNCPVVTATQLGRAAFDKVDPGLEHTSESIGLAMTADAQFAIWSDEHDKELGIIHMGCQKNRFGVNFGKEAFRIDYDTLSIETMNEDFTSSDSIGEAQGSIEDLLSGLK